MILRELYYFDDKTKEPVEDLRYNEGDDELVVKKDDSRKSRLSLKDINRARKASDAKKMEQDRDRHYIRQMYGLAAQAAAGV
jgi:hypothetical protein